MSVEELMDKSCVTCAFCARQKGAVEHICTGKHSVAKEVFNFILGRIQIEDGAISSRDIGLEYEDRYFHRCSKWNTNGKCSHHARKFK